MGGSGGSKTSSGGSSGRVDWPGYYKDLHRTMMQGSSIRDGDVSESWGKTRTNINEFTADDNYVSVLRDVVEAHEASPFSGVTAYPTATRLAAMATQFTTFEGLLSALDPATDWTTYLTQAKTKVDELLAQMPTSEWESLLSAVKAKLEAALLDETTLADRITQYSASLATEMNRNLSTFATGMADIGAINSSAYVVGKAMMLNEKSRQVAQFTAELHNQAYRDKLDLTYKGVQQVLALYSQQMAMVQQGAQEMTRMLMYEVDANRVAVQLKAELERIGIVAQKEEADKNVELTLKDTLWELEVWQYGANMLASAQGGMASPSHAERSSGSGMSQLGGALSGAATGAMAGMAFGNPLIGAGIGAAIGGLLG